MRYIANTTIGKKWEDKFKSTWEKQFPGRLIYRLPDQQSGYAGGGGSNPCDFISKSAATHSNFLLFTRFLSKRA